MSAHVELPEEVVEYLEHYRDGRCPELAACLFEELAARSRCTESDTERCLCYLLLRNWGGIDRTRRDLPSPRLAAAEPASEAHAAARSERLVARRSHLAGTLAPPLRIVKNAFTRRSGS